jgi:hypothetical protein
MITILGQRDIYCPAPILFVFSFPLCIYFVRTAMSAYYLFIFSPVCAVCNYPLSAACCLNRICSALEQKWNIQ